MKKLVLILLVTTTAVVYSCKKETSVTKSGEVYLDLPSATAKYYDDNTGNLNEQATLGRVLFYERRLSLNNSVSCASCHKQQFAFSDNVAFSRGFENRLTGRNSMPIQNLGMSGFFPGSSQATGSFFWDGRETNLKDLIARPMTNHVEMGIDDLSKIPAKLATMPYYQELFTKAFGSADITMDRIAEAMVTFMTAISSVHTKLDKTQIGGMQFSALEQEGLRLFNEKYDCQSCHQLSPMGYNSSAFMNIGLDYPNTDLGVGEVTKSPQNNGKFKIPNLRNVAITAPYMHDGRFATLEEVLDHYSHGIKDDPNLDPRLRTLGTGEPIKMNISPQEKQALIAFLNTLTDYGMVTDQKFSDPFKTK